MDYVTEGYAWDRMLRSHIVWNKAHPDNPIVKGDGHVLHHKDEDKTNDSLDNLQKMTDADHRRLHSHVGVKALAKWREENPDKARAASQKGIAKMRKRARSDPVLLKKICDNRRKAMNTQSYHDNMSAAKQREWANMTGEKREKRLNSFKRSWTDERKKATSERMKRIWAERRASH